jgi:UDPglucose 6-dehydrogenase
MTEWKEFSELNLPLMKKRANGSILIDLRNMFTVDAAVGAGFEYWCIGRDSVLPSLAVAAE